MPRSARRPSRAAAGAEPVRAAQSGIGGFVTRNPIFTGGTTAFLVAFSYVSANALWYQPHAHRSAFFATRPLEWSTYSHADPAEAETTIRIERNEQPAIRPLADPVVEQVQEILTDLNFYDGAVDGIAGPATRQAIEAYRESVGLPASGEIDDELLIQLGTAPSTGAIAPSDEGAESDPASGSASAENKPADKARITKIQAGLKAFGNADMEIDGIMGARTQAAIREFQSLFGLPETGEPDEALYAKMKEIGLTN